MFLDILNKSFLGEPAYRWVVFMVCATFMLAAWKGVLRHI